MEGRMRRKSAEETMNFEFSNLPGLPVVANDFGESSALMSGNSVPQWYGAEGSGEIDHDRIDREETQEVIFRYDHPMTFYDWSVDGDVTDEQIDEIRDGIYDTIGSGPEEGDEDFDVTLEDGRDTYVQTQTQYGDSRFYGLAAEEFEAPMPSYPPSKGDVDRVQKAIRSRHQGIRFKGSPTYLTERKDGSNKYHVFQMTNRGGFNGYGSDRSHHDLIRDLCLHNNTNPNSNQK